MFSSPPQRASETGNTTPDYQYYVLNSAKDASLAVGKANVIDISMFSTRPTDLADIVNIRSKHDDIEIENEAIALIRLEQCFDKKQEINFKVINHCKSVILL